MSVRLTLSARVAPLCSRFGADWRERVIQGGTGGASLIEAETLAAEAMTD
jgi:hypothetical protein